MDENEMDSDQHSSSERRESNPSAEPVSDSGEKPPLGQRFYDSPFILLALGMVIMLVFYTLWGLYEVTSLPRATLP